MKFRHYVPFLLSLALVLIVFVLAISLSKRTTEKLVDEEPLPEQYEKKERSSLSKLERIDQAFQHEFEKTKDPKLDVVPRERLIKARAAVMESLAKNGSITGIDWEERGPDNVGGRTRAILVDAADASNNTVYAGGVAGGLWKTTNFLATTPTWTPINDFFENIAVASIVQDPTDPQVIYFGTGEGWFNADAVRGLGIWKTENGGAIWNQLSSTDNPTFYYVQDLIIDDNGALYAATRSGLQRSTDGGMNWTQVLSGRTADLELGAGGDVYATIGIFSTGAVWKSDFATHGVNTGANDNWIDITPTGSFRRIELACAPSDEDIVYILCHSSIDNNVSDIFRSDNAAGNSGITWTSLPVPTIIDQKSNPADRPPFTRNQAWYDLIAAVDPNNADIVYIGGIDALRSVNAGADWEQISTWALFAATPTFSVDQQVHADHHAIVFMPGSSTNVIWGTDGGLDYTTDANNTVGKPTWVSKNSGYNVTQFYSCATSNEAGATNFLGGTQDNGTQRFTASGLNSTQRILGGDGGFCHIDEDEPNVQIASTQNNGFIVTNNSWASSSSRPVSGGTFTSISDYDSKFNIMYAASSSSQFGFIKDVGTNNTTGVTTLTNQNSSISTIAVSPNVDKRVYFGLGNARILKVDNADAASPSSTIITPSGAAGTVSCVAIETDNEDHLLASYSNYGVISIYESMDGGSNWMSVEGNLPDMPVRWAIFNPINSDQALLATEMGVWSTNDLNGINTVWGSTNANLANTRVDMLQVRPSDNFILAATHGRGLFTTDNFAVANVNFSNASSSEAETSTSMNCPAFKDITVGIQSVPIYLNDDIEIAITIDNASTATEGIDFELLDPNFTYDAAGSTIQNINLRIFDDAAIEGNETVILNLNVTNNGTSGAINGTQTQTTITIQDDDVSPEATTELENTIGSFSFLSSTPFDGRSEDSRYQYIIKASELTGAGFSAGEITEFALNVNSKNSTIPFSNFKIRMANTLSSSLGNFSNISTTEVFSDDVSTTLGWNNFVLTNSFIWDGTSNVLIDICFDNTATSDWDRIVTYDEGTANFKTIYIADDGIDACNIAGGQFGDNLKPYTRLKIGDAVFAETTLGEFVEETLGADQTVYFYSSDGDILAKIENLDAHDYGCTIIEIDRAGTSSIAQLGVETTSKAFLITPTDDNPTGNLRVTIYYTEAEIVGFESSNSGGQTRNDLLVAKSASSFTSATDAVTQPTTSATLPSGGIAYTATFNTGFSGFTLADAALANGSCDTDIIFEDETVSSGTYQASNAITTIGTVTIENGATVNFEAGGTVILSQGFLAPNGTTLSISNNFSVGGTCSDLQDDVIEGRSSEVDLVQAPQMLVAPNPFNNITNIDYQLSEASAVTVEVYDTKGKMIRTLTKQYHTAGAYQVRFDASGLKPSIYMVVLKTDKQSLIQKIVLIE